MKYAIYNIHFKSGKTILAAQKLENDDLILRRNTSGDVTGVDYNFKSIPSLNIGCPHILKFSDIECFEYLYQWEDDTCENN